MPSPAPTRENLPNPTNDAYHTTDFSIPLSDRVTAYLASVTNDPNHNGFDAPLLREISIKKIRPETQEITYEFTVQPFMCNKDGNLHGGAASTLCDNLSSTALLTVSKPGFWSNFGVTRTLSTIFYRPLPLGMKATVVCTVLNVGRRMASVRAVLRDDRGRDCVFCVHEKVDVGKSAL
ncbi:HotDog domain-containing protein [Aspergillus heterothallicus]